MKKKLLTLTFTLILLIGLVAAMGINASAATSNIEITAATGVGSYAGLADYLNQLRPKTYFKLTSDIIVTDDTKDLSLPVDASGTFVLDLNGHEIIINSDKTSSVFNIGSYFSTDFHIINSSATRSGITLNSITDGASVFYINDERSSLHIYEGIDIGVCLDGNYFESQSLSPATLCGIRANKFDTIALHGADIYNRSSYGIGIRFDSDASGSKLILDGDVEISSKNTALDFRGISTAYPTVTIKTLHAKYEDALPVNPSNYSSVDEYIAIKGMSGTAKFSDIAPSGTNGFYGTNADVSYSLFINDTDYINNSKYKGKNISISYPSCGHSQGYECCLRLFVPNQTPLHFTVCSYCGEKATYNACTFITKADPTETADGHTAGYDCYCGYKTIKTLHYYEEYAKVEPTCTEYGYKNTMYKCKNCATYLDRNKNETSFKEFSQNRIPALGHDMVKVEAKKATLTADGCTAYYDCSRCDHITSDAEGKVAVTPTKIVKIKSVTLSQTEYIHDGKNKTPTVTVKDANGKKLIKNTDYKISVASKRSGIGKYTVKVTFTGKYSGTKNVYFTILPGKPATVKSAAQTTSSVKLTWSKVSGAAGYTVYRYSSSKKAYVKAGTTTGTSFTVKKLYDGTKYTFKVVAYGKTSGGKVYHSELYTLLKTATKTKTPVISKVTTTKGKAVLTHTDVSGETGYTVYYSTKKDSGFKKYNNFKANTKTATVSKLTSGKTYYFKVRTYIKTDSGYVYSAWSAVKGIKVK